MPRKKLNGNIIGVRWQDIRLCGEIIAVNRRTGGLENEGGPSGLQHYVNRRIGGLEITLLPSGCHDSVNRRIGGLEIFNTGRPAI